MKDRIKKFYYEHKEVVLGITIGSAVTAIAAVYVVLQATEKTADKRRIVSAENFMDPDGRDILVLFGKNGDLRQVLTKPAEKP